ncbi:ribonuclease H-like domain-containing protein [Nocardioides sp. 31GB23]|uniref:ribonuclease H-like domain-containing protein n=1 Tax=Nocardioides sp. 31GB23 TaxID=3156065 RepID=UPI0032AFEE93
MSARSDLMDRLVTRSSGVVSEATIQSDVRMLLLDPDLGLTDVNLETQVGATHRRIDVEVGCTVIEVKRTLATPSALQAATTQLADYVTTRTQEMGQRYIGILTDGLSWIAFHEVEGHLHEATRHSADAGEAGATALLGWLEGVLATKTAVRPTPGEIEDRLGAGSSSHALDHATLAALYAEHRNQPTVQLKRALWADLLRSALGTQFTDSDELFLDHTLLVNSAEIIAHLVVGLDATELSAEVLLTGEKFTEAGLRGVVDRDFFDWVLEVPGGDGFITALARRLARFDWSAVEHDVLKVLYESVIRPEVRKALGEYYTPDWLANRVVAEVVTDPLNQRVVDPSCGSGTFVFFAVRRFFDAAAEQGMPLAEAMSLVSSRVIGIDLHPVAVALARVTYLLALGRERLTSPERGSLSVPVYLGDSLGWDQDDDILSVDMLIVPTDVGDQFFSHPLRFPSHLLEDSGRFDDLVETLVAESGRAAHTKTVTLSRGTVRRLGLAEADLVVLNENFVRLKQLHEDNRDHIWSYYIRNVARPAWLSREENRVDVLTGNPPWLSYRHMTKDMQKKFKSMAKTREFWGRENTATHQDLAGLFVARAVERYLKTGGRLAFVVPNSVIDRDYWAGFRNGEFDGARVRFTIPWDLRRVRPHMFPRGSAVIFGERALKARTMPTEAVVWRGRAPRRHAALEVASGLEQSLEALTIGSADDELSPYHSRFSQGATLVPRLLCRVEPGTTSALGVPAGMVAVQSARSASEKAPWKTLSPLTGTVEQQFVRATYLGEHVVPFRTLTPDTFVVPIDDEGTLLHGEDPAIDSYPGVAAWMRTAEDLWNEHSAGTMTLAERFDYMRTLTQQAPAAPLRVTYSKSGMHVAAALVKDPEAVIDHALYWGAVSSELEGHYLVGVLNSPSLTDLVRPLMSYGKDERHIDKAVWKLPIPLFDRDNDLHLDLAATSAQMAAELAERELVSEYFVTVRQDFRKWVEGSALGRRLDDLVRALLGEPPRTDADRDAAPAPIEAGTLLRLTSAPLGLEPADVEIDLDIEYDDERRVYLWGFLVSDPEQLGDDPENSRYVHVGSGLDDVDERALADEFLQEIKPILEAAATAGRSIRVFHYGAVEVQFMQQLLGGRADEVVAVATDLLAVVRDHFFSAAGYGLKKVAPLAGARWRVAGLDGAAAHQWVAKARAGDDSAWADLVAYNEDDVRATRALRTMLRSGNAPGGARDCCTSR